jgi:hypothetical protein
MRSVKAVLRHLLLVCWLHKRNRHGEGVDAPEAAVGIALPCNGVPANVTVVTGSCGHGEDSGGVLAASFCVLGWKRARG